MIAALVAALAVCSWTFLDEAYNRGVLNFQDGWGSINNPQNVFAAAHNMIERPYRSAQPQWTPFGLGILLTGFVMLMRARFYWWPIHPIGLLAISNWSADRMWVPFLLGWLTKVGLQASDVTWIAMRGSAPSLQELMAGGLDMVACSLPEAQILLNADKVRCLGVMAGQRVPAFPDVLTFQELGVDWHISAYRGIALPLGVPEPRIRFLRDAVARAATSNEYLQYLENTGAGAVAMPSEEFARFLVRTDKAFGDIFAGPSFQGFEHQYGPVFFPALLFGLLVVCLVACFASGSLRRGAERQEISPAAMLDMFILVGCVILYLLTAEMLGFILSSAAILLILFWRMRVTKTTAVLATVLLTALVYQLFAIFLRVPLPRGLFGW